MISLFGRYKKENKEFYNFFRNVLGFTPRNTEVYQLAFIHRSKSQDLGHGHRVNNERLEYLGDAVLSAVVAEYLYKKYPFQGEGFLTEMRSKIVSRASLNKLAQKIGLSQLIQYNKESQGVFKSIDGDAMEALVGAIYLEKGYKFTRRLLVKRIFSTYMDIEGMEHTDWNYKGKLIDWGQKEGRKVQFEVVRTIIQGHNNRKQYECRVVVDGRPFYAAIDYNIKAAEQLAAEKCFKCIKANPDTWMDFLSEPKKKTKKVDNTSEKDVPEQPSPDMEVEGANDEQNDVSSPLEAVIDVAVANEVAEETVSSESDSPSCGNDVAEDVADDDAAIADAEEKSIGEETEVSIGEDEEEESTSEVESLTPGAIV